MFSGNRNRASPSSSSKSSVTTTSSSSPHPHPHPNPNPPPQTQTMEDVWNDISLTSLHHHSSASASAAARDHTRIILQDFLPLPSSPKDPPPTVSSAAYASPALPPPTALSLNSGPDFHFLASSDPLRPTFMLQSPPISSISSLDGSSFDALAKKRVHDSGNNSSDRRHKRMIKNRESAARSRARKQAYTNELELEVAHLMEENAKLKKQQQQQQLLVAASSQFAKKHSLLRASTAPF